MEKHEGVYSVNLQQSEWNGLDSTALRTKRFVFYKEGQFEITSALPEINLQKGTWSLDEGPDLYMNDYKTGEDSLRSDFFPRFDLSFFFGKKVKLTLRADTLFYVKEVEN